MKNKVHRTAHFEVCMGTPEQNIAYCSKEKNTTSYYKEFGASKKQGERTDIMEAIHASKGNIGFFMDNHTMLYARYKSAMIDLLRREAFKQTKDWTKRIIWMKGPTGCGKTKMATEFCPEDFWINSGTLEWFDNYTSQQTAVIDDFRKEQLPKTGGLPFFLRLLDRYKMMV